MMKYPVGDQVREQIENSFTYHSPKDDQPERYELIRGIAKQFALLLHESVPPGRYLSMAITDLERCVAMANKGIACGE